MIRSNHPLWLVTLADLSLLLVGFFVFMQASARKDAAQQTAITAGIREAFGGAPEARIQLDSNIVDGFTPKSASLPRGLSAVTQWAREALTDPRTKLVVTGYADSGESLTLAAERADAVIAALSAIPGDRVRPAAAIAPGARRVTLAISYDQ